MVMRVRRPALLFVSMVLLGGGCLLLLNFTRGNSSAVSFNVLSYTNQDGSTDALVLLSNKSSAPITFDTWNFTEPPLKIASETSKGWTNYEPKYETFEAIAV